MAVITKNSKNNKITSYPEPLGIIGYTFAWNINGTLVFKIVKNTKKKKKTAEIGHSDLLSVYKSNFAQKPISQENSCGPFHWILFKEANL